MKITATQRKSIDVELDDFTVRRIVISQFCKVFNILENYYINDDKVMHDEEIGMGSHSMTIEKFVRDATEEDKVAILSLAILQKEL